MNLETQKGDKNNSIYLKYKGTKTGLGIGSVGGAILGGILGFAGVASLPAIGIGLGVAAAGTLIGSFFN